MPPRADDVRDDGVDAFEAFVSVDVEARLTIVGRYAEADAYYPGGVLFDDRADAFEIAAAMRIVAIDPQIREAVLEKQRERLKFFSPVQRLRAWIA